MKYHPYRRLTALLGLVALPWLGCTTAPAPRKITAWITGPDEQLHATSPAIGENAVYSAARGEIRLTGALNETIAFQLALRSGASFVGPYDVQVSDLTGPGGRVLSRDDMRLYRVHDATVVAFRSWYPDHTGKPAVPTAVPDILVPWDAPTGGGPVRLDGERNEIVWVDVHVPVTLAPGQYRGRLELVSPNAPEPAFAATISLDVVGVALPGPRSLPVLCRVDPRNLLARHLNWPAASAPDTRLLPGHSAHDAGVRLVRNTMALFHEHRMSPLLWASFPKYRLAGDRRVEIDWESYDALVSPWLDGSAFEDQVRLAHWLIPASLEHPEAARNGGLESPRYARLLSAYLAECRRHFEERGWLDRAVLRLCPPEPLSQAAIDRVRYAAAIVRQSEAALPIVGHLPGRSLAGLGWHEAPALGAIDIEVWCPPALWYEPQVLEQFRHLGQRTWIMPDYPPYSGSLGAESLPTDTRSLPWLAFRYGATAVWIENAAEIDNRTPQDARHPWASDALIYSGLPYGLTDQPVPSVRLKRLRRGEQDFELLKLLAANGKKLLAQSLAERVVRWGCTDACLENLLSTRPAGWPRDPLTLRRARDLVLTELASSLDPDAADRARQIAVVARWAQMWNRPERIAVSVDGVRLARSQVGLQAHVVGNVLNTTNRLVQGRWMLVDPPPGWQQMNTVLTAAPPDLQAPARLELALEGLAFNADGTYPFKLNFNSTATGTIPVRARLAVAACREISEPPRIDGWLDDWPLAVNNTAADFRLCRSGATPLTEVAPAPSLPTRAYFAHDREHLYIAVRCTLAPGEAPLWEADNLIPVDGAMPWGQDVIEVLIEPQGIVSGTAGDIYCLQIKPSGLLLARRGCRTEPPMGATASWNCGARAAVTLEADTWVTELAIPLASFGPRFRRNDIWGFNVTRFDARRGEYSSWSGARGYCYSPQSLGNLIMLWP